MSTIVPPQSWRMVRDRVVRDDETFIPMTPRDLEVFRKFQEGPTEGERAAMLTKSEQREAERVAEMKSLRERHEFLLKFSVAPVVTTLLEQHAPRECVVRFGTVVDECHGCPESHDAEYGESYQPWPCPTWQTISDATP